MASFSQPAWRVRRPAARLGAGMSTPRGDDPAASLNQVLSEVIDGVLDVKQAHRRVPEAHALHAELDQLFDDLRAWARLIDEQDRALGISPLESMPTSTGRQPPHSWHGAASDDEVRRIVGEDLDRLAQYLAAALSAQSDDNVRAALAEIERGVIGHKQALSEV
jgi:DNA-binding ferritin-like protein